MVLASWAATICIIAGMCRICLQPPQIGYWLVGIGFMLLVLANA